MLHFWTIRKDMLELVFRSSWTGLPLEPQCALPPKFRFSTAFLALSPIQEVSLEHDDGLHLTRLGCECCSGLLCVVCTTSVFVSRRASGP